jgi:hypothetical protein
MAELRSPLHKLVLQGFRCQEVVVAHSFPRLLSLSIDIHSLHPDFFAFLSRSSRLEMLAVRAWSSVTTADTVALLLATPSLRILHFRDSHTAMVTYKFHTFFVPPTPDDPFDPVEPQSLADLNVEKCFAMDDFRVLAWIRWRMEHFPWVDPNGIEKARLQIEGVPFDPEAELDYPSYIS